MPQIVTDEHLKSAQGFKQIYSRYSQNKDLISIGAYAPGSDPETDLAIQLQPAMKSFLQQSMKDAHPLESSISGLGQFGKAMAGQQAGAQNKPRLEGAAAAQAQQPPAARA
jgi:flagellum-specific ATP synthase